MQSVKKTAALRGGGPLSDPLSKLGQLATLGNSVPIVKLPELDLPSPEDMEQRAQTIMERANSISQWTAIALAEMAKIGTLSREAQELAHDKVVEIEGGTPQFPVQ